MEIWRYHVYLNYKPTSPPLSNSRDETYAAADKKNALRMLSSSPPTPICDCEVRTARRLYKLYFMLLVIEFLFISTYEFRLFLFCCCIRTPYTCITYVIRVFLKYKITSPLMKLVINFVLRR